MTLCDRSERVPNVGVEPEKGVMLCSHLDTYSQVMTT